MNTPRHAEIGDMVLQKESRLAEPKWFGVVYNITYDSYGTATCFLAWTPELPPNYNVNYGYSQTNIHNQRSKFDVIKK